MQKLIDGGIECHHSRPDHGREGNLELPNETRYGRLIAHTEIYLCAKRACVTLGAIHLSRIGKRKSGERTQENHGSIR